MRSVRRRPWADQQAMQDLVARLLRPAVIGPPSRHRLPQRSWTLTRRLQALLDDRGVSADCRSTPSAGRANSRTSSEAAAMGEHPVIIWNMSQNSTFCARSTAHLAPLPLMPNRQVRIAPPESARSQYVISPGLGPSTRTRRYARTSAVFRSRCWPPGSGYSARLRAGAGRAIAFTRGRPPDPRGLSGVPHVAAIGAVSAFGWRLASALAPAVTVSGGQEGQWLFHFSSGAPVRLGRTPGGEGGAAVLTASCRQDGSAAGLRALLAPRGPWRGLSTAT